MTWHKEGVHENEQVMVHPSDSEPWKALDNFDADFTRDARNVRIGLAIDGFTLQFACGIILMLAHLCYSV
jgi:hypothetical protein